MEYITKLDIRDKLLKVVERDVLEANDYVDSLAIGLGVDTSKMQGKVPAKIKRLAVVYACYLCCLNSVGMDSTTTFDNGERTDVFEQKRSAYKKELDGIVAGLTAVDFLGGRLSGNNISIWRA